VHHRVVDLDRDVITHDPRSRPPFSPIGNFPVSSTSKFRSDAASFAATEADQPQLVGKCVGRRERAIVSASPPSGRPVNSALTNPQPARTLPTGWGSHLGHEEIVASLLAVTLLRLKFSATTAHVARVIVVVIGVAWS